MKTPQSAAAIEPSVEAVVTVRQRLHQMGFILNDDDARDLLRAVFAVESARLDRRAREAATACLRSIQDAAQEAVRILTQGPAAPRAQAAPPKPPPGPSAAGAHDAAARGAEGVNLADVVRRRLAEETPSDQPPRRAPEPPPANVPARPVFKGRRGR
jgi:hypothetical protein